MKTKNAPTTGTTKKNRPVTLIIKGGLAVKIREGAKRMGFRASNWARMCAVAGDMAIGIPSRSPIYFPAQTVKLLEELLEASGTALSTEEYAEKFLQEEILASLKPRECGVPEVLDASYELGPDDMPAMQAVIDRWNAS